MFGFREVENKLKYKNKIEKIKQKLKTSRYYVGAA